jgi:hypothetical protein
MGCASAWSARRTAAAPSPTRPASIPPGCWRTSRQAAASGAAPGGVLGASALDLLSQVHADVLLEASPVNLVNAEPAVSTVLAALERGIDVVLANKAPLALYYPRLRAAAAAHGARLAFSATVCGGLPVVNVGTRDLVAAQRPARRRGSSTAPATTSCQPDGGRRRPMPTRLAEAQRRGIAETNPTPGRGRLGHRQQADHRGQRGARLRPPPCATCGRCRASGRRSPRATPASGCGCWALAELREDGGYDLSVQPVALARDSTSWRSVWMAGRWASSSRATCSSRSSSASTSAALPALQRLCCATLSICTGTV